MKVYICIVNRLWLDCHSFSIIYIKKHPKIHMCYDNTIRVVKGVFRMPIGLLSIHTKHFMMVTIVVNDIGVAAALYEDSGCSYITTKFLTFVIPVVSFNKATH